MKKRIRKIGTRELSEMIRKTLNETFEGGVNYDSDVAVELQSKVGQLSKITPYVLELGDKVASDSTGKILVYSNGRLVAKFSGVDDFLSKGIRYTKVKINEEGSGKSLTANELAAKYNLQKTGPTGKFRMADFQPVLDEGSEEDKYALALIFANMFLGKNFGFSWDDLPDINSLWDCVESSDTVDELIANVKDACRERISEEGGDMF